STPAGRRSAEQPFEQVAEVGRLAAAEIEALEAAGARLRPACSRRIAAETRAERHLGIAVLVDLAAVVAGALVLVREQIVGVGDLSEALGRVGIVLVAVGVELLGEAAVRLLDLGVARAALNAQALVQVQCHAAPMPQRFPPDQMGCCSCRAKMLVRLSHDRRSWTMEA